MKVIIEVKTYLMADVKDTDDANRCGGRLSEVVAETNAGFSPHTDHITTGFSVCALGECTWLTEEAVKQASQRLDDRDSQDRPESSDKATSESILSDADLP